VPSVSDDDREPGIEDYPGRPRHGIHSYREQDARQASFDHA